MATGFKQIKSEIIKTANMGGVDKSTTCMYRRHTKRYCAITSHESCKRCRFYEPSTQATYEIALDMVQHSRALVDTVNKEFCNLANISKQLHGIGLRYIPDRIDKSVTAIKEKE